MTTNLELAEPTTAPTGPCMCCDDLCPHYDECCPNEASLWGYNFGDEEGYVPICIACNEYELFPVSNFRNLSKQFLMDN